MKMRKWIMLIIPLLALGFVLAACDGGDDEEGGGGGLADGTPVVGETPDIGDTDVMTDEMPLETATVEMEPTIEVNPTVEMSPTIEMTATAEMTATTEVTTEVTVEATEVMTEDGTAETMGPDAVMLVSDFVDAEVHNPTGEEIGSVWEILADEQGTIQYVLVNMDALATDVDDTSPGDTVTDTTEIAGTAPFELVALTWDGFEVELDDETEETDDVTLVYSGDTEALDTSALEEEFLSFLDEDGYVLENDADSDFTLPTEFTGLIQVGEYDDFDLEDAAGEDLGEVEDLLIDMSTGEIVYGIADIGGFLGIGENSIAIPWSAMTLQITDEDGERDEVFTLDVTEDFLNEAPTIELDDWSPLIDEGWDEAFSGYWESMTTTS